MLRDEISAAAGHGGACGTASFSPSISTWACRTAGAAAGVIEQVMGVWALRLILDEPLRRKAVCQRPWIQGARCGNQVHVAMDGASSSSGQPQIIKGAQTFRGASTCAAAAAAACRSGEIPIKRASVSSAKEALTKGPSSRRPSAMAAHQQSLPPNSAAAGRSRVRPCRGHDLEPEPLPRGEGRTLGHAMGSPA